MFGGSGGDKDNCKPSKGSNATLTDHLKRCVGLGCNLPPLIEKCEDIPGYCDKKKASSCGSAFPCPNDKPKKEECTPKKVECDPKCPPMPCTDCSKCRPAWMECPPSRFTRTYPVPKGVTVQPISVGGRNGTGLCNRCGDKPRKPKVSANCPMMRPKCPGVAAEDNKPGFFAKLMALFGLGKK